MRIYFLSRTHAMLRLNGAYAGKVDMFERRVELNINKGVFVEMIPDKNLQPINFFLNREFLNDPPAFAEVYLTDGGALICAREFFSKDPHRQTLAKILFMNREASVFRQGDVYFAWGDKSPVPLGEEFAKAQLFDRALCGRRILEVTGGKCRALFSESGNALFSGEAELDFGDRLRANIPFETCAPLECDCEYLYDGERLKLVKSDVREKSEPPAKLLPFAFFESVLFRADFAKYLAPSALARADEIRDYLGEFTAVVPTTERFCLAHPNLPAAGLCYPKKENLYEVVYYALELENGGISNIYPVI